jgi:hypothetical protein
MHPFETRVMQQQSQLAQRPADPEATGEPNVPWEDAKSGEGAASALEALKKARTTRHQLQPNEEHPAAD